MNARLRRLVANSCSCGPVLEDPAREGWLELRVSPGQLMTLPAPEPDPERALLADEEINVVATTRWGGRAPGR